LASGVACRRPPARSKSLIFKRLSSCFSDALTAGWVTFSTRAASLIEPARMIA
jgi:hypothetical protein